MPTYTCYQCEYDFEREKPPKNPDKCFCCPKCLSQYACGVQRGDAPVAVKEVAIKKPKPSKHTPNDFNAMVKAEYTKALVAASEVVKGSVKGRKFPDYPVGSRVIVTCMRRVGFDAREIEGTVQRCDETGENGWVRVNLSNGFMDTFRHNEVRPVR